MKKRAIINISEDFYEKLRELAFKQKTSISALVNEAITQKLGLTYKPPLPKEAISVGKEEKPLEKFSYFNPVPKPKKGR